MSTTKMVAIELRKRKGSLNILPPNKNYGNTKEKNDVGNERPWKCFEYKTKNDVGKIDVH